MKHLILGGIKSGKSLYAERLAADYLSSEIANDGSSSSSSSSSGSGVGVVVTAEALDDEMHVRIQKHKDQRPDGWLVVEAPVDISSAIKRLADDPAINVILIDCLTLWLTNVLVKPALAGQLDDKVSELLSAVVQVGKPLIVVSNETNMGLIGMDALTRRFCDVAGKLHQELAKVCDHVDLIVAGLPLHVK